MEMQEETELLVVDSNSSTENRTKNQSIAQLFGAKYIYESTQGLSRARNKGIEFCRTDYLYFLDDDVVILNNHPMILLRLLRHRNVDLIGGPVETVFPETIPDWYDKKWNVREHQTKSGFGTRRLSGGNFGGKTAIFRRLGGFNEQLGMRGQKVLVGEERDFVERYLNYTEKPKVYYSLDLKVYEPIPINKMRLSYRIRREFAVGRANVRKLDHRYTNESFLNWAKESLMLFYKTKKIQGPNFRVRFLRKFLKIVWVFGIAIRNFKWTHENKILNRPKTIILFYEHITRELPTLMHMKNRLTETGTYRVIIANILTDLWIVRFLKPHFCIIPYFYDIRTDATGEIIDELKNTIFISLSWEQIFYPAKQSSKMPVSIPGNLYLLTWTKTWSRTLAKKVKDNSQIIHLGHPTWSSVFADETPTQIPKEDTILYIENSSIAFAKLSALKKMSNSSDDVKIEFQHLLEGNLRMLNNIQKLGMSRVIIRVRPATPIRTFIEFANQIVPDNEFTFVKGNSLDNDLNTSTIVLTEMSTSLLECALKSKPCALLQSSNISPRFSYSWFAFFPRIKSVNELKQYLKARNKSTHGKLQRWLERENAVNTQYYEDFLSILKQFPKSPYKYRNQFYWKISWAFVYLWQEIVSFKPLGNIIVKINGKFSIESHESDFIRPSKYHTYGHRNVVS
jgi:glycosyltransferase involved in cell wall biosynthesis